MDRWFNFRKLVLSLSLLGVWGLTGQNPEREFMAGSRQGQKVEVRTNDGTYIFQYYTPEILETSFVPSDEQPEPNSHAVILEPQMVNFTLADSSAEYVIDSEGIDVRIRKDPFQVQYFFQEEEVISENRGYFKDDNYEKLRFNLNETEALFGGGARALGMNRRGHKLELYNRAHYGYGSRSELLNYTLPVVISSQKYALHFDNAPIGFLDLDSQNNHTLTYETISGRKTYQLVVGETWKDLVGNYTLLTGRQPMPPRWALGNFASRFGYHSQQEVMQTIRKFREEEIPVDAMVLDLFWFGHEVKGTMGNLSFVRDSFPQPKEMIRDLARDGVKTVLITEPFIVTTSKRWEEAVSENILATDSEGAIHTFDFFFGHTGLIDIFDPDARRWFWNIYQELSAMGVAGWWGDLGEPEVHPETLKHEIGTANEVHNIYGHYWAKLIYEGYAEHFPKQRPFILMRAGAAGSQRFGLIPWSGDVSRSWEGLMPQPEIALQMGLQGLAYMHSDLGGFAGDITNDDLYIRWLQYGVFQPVFRPHAQEAVPSEPVFRSARAKKMAKQAVELRYKLLPYNYTLSFENTIEGIPLMRPLFFEEPDNFRLYDVSNEYLWGNDFLVSPVVRPHVKEKRIYFPGKSSWFDFYSGKKYSGGRFSTVEIREEYIPTFVRGGAFIPMAKPMQSTDEFTADHVELHFFYDQEVGESSGKLYFDDGKTSGTYASGNFEMLRFHSLNKEDSLEIIIQKKHGHQQKESSFSKLDLHLQNFPNTKAEVMVNGNQVIPKDASEALVIPVDLKDNQTTIIINY